MKDLLLDAVLDTLKICPFLFLSFVLIAFFEQKFAVKSLQTLNKTLKGGPLVGALLGIVPQCGFSVFATDMYVMKIITVGTLLAVYLSTSDELLPILISSGAPLMEMLKIIAVKVIVAVASGFAIDYLLKDKKEEETYAEICGDPCCSNGVFLPAVNHTLRTGAYILLTNIVLSLLIHYIGQENIAQFLCGKSILTPLLASLVGLIPNCAASVIITELYINHMINFSSCIAGLLTGTGIAVMVLLTENKEKLKDNLKILFVLYGVGAFTGILLSLLGM